MRDLTLAPLVLLGTSIRDRQPLSCRHGIHKRQLRLSNGISVAMSWNEAIIPGPAACTHRHYVCISQSVSPTLGMIEQDDDALVSPGAWVRTNTPSARIYGDSGKSGNTTQQVCTVLTGCKGVSNIPFSRCSSALHGRWEPYPPAASTV